LQEQSSPLPPLGEKKNLVLIPNLPLILEKESPNFLISEPKQNSSLPVPFHLTLKMVIAFKLPLQNLISLNPYFSRTASPTLTVMRATNRIEKRRPWTMSSY